MTKFPLEFIPRGDGILRQNPFLAHVEMRDPPQFLIPFLAERLNMPGTDNIACDGSIRIGLSFHRVVARIYARLYILHVYVQVNIGLQAPSSTASRSTETTSVNKIGLRHDQAREELLGCIPALKAGIEKIFGSYYDLKEDFPDAYTIFEAVVKPAFLEILDNDDNVEMCSALFTLFERMAASEDSEVRDLWASQYSSR